MVHYLTIKLLLENSIIHIDPVTAFKNVVRDIQLIIEKVTHESNRDYDFILTGVVFSIILVRGIKVYTCSIGDNMIFVGE